MSVQGAAVDILVHGNAHVKNILTKILTKNIAIVRKIGLLSLHMSHPSSMETCFFSVVFGCLRTRPK